MNCLIVDDEPLAREAVQLLLNETPQLHLAASFDSAAAASRFMKENPVDVIFLDIQMPGLTGIEFAREIPKTTLVIFTTAYSDYALESYEVDAVDFLVKPIETPRFIKAVNKAVSYHGLLLNADKDKIEQVEETYFFVKSDRRYFKVNFDEILFIEGLKDYVIIQTDTQRLITKMNLKGIFCLLPEKRFFRISKSYIVNSERITSFDNNDVFIGTHEIAIGASYRDMFFEEFVQRKRK